MDRFEKAYARDAVQDMSATGSWQLPAGLEAGATGFGCFVVECGGASFNNGLYRVHSPPEVSRWTAIVGEVFTEFKNRILCFSYDWLGRHFAIDRARQDKGQFLILMLEPGTGKAFQIPSSFRMFHEKELVEYQNEALAANFYESWLSSGGQVPGLTECIGYKKPLFLGGRDTIENLEISDMEVYWSVFGQLLSRVRNLPDGSRVGRIDISQQAIAPVRERLAF